MFRKVRQKDGSKDMSIQLVIASTAITAALVFYTIGVFGERRSGTLSRVHLGFFWGGLICDATGTTLMSGIAQQSGASGFGVHAVTGVLAIVLMLVHAGWATITYIRQNEKSMKRFHTFSTMVWLVWLVPYIIGMLVGIPFFHLAAGYAIGIAVVVVAVFATILYQVSKRRAHTA